MTKISKETSEAFLNNKYYSNTNTKVMGGAIYLYKNKIAIINHDTKIVEISLARWNTKTTRDRLNAIQNVSIRVKKGVPYLNGEIINSHDWYKIVI